MDSVIMRSDRCDHNYELTAEGAATSYLILVGHSPSVDTSI